SIVDRTVVVIGHDHDAVRQALKNRPVLVAHNEQYRDGMLSSVRRGIAEMGGAGEAYLIALGDQPNIPPATINALLNYFARSGSSIVVPTFGGSRATQSSCPQAFAT